MSVEFRDTQWVFQSVAGATLADVVANFSESREAAKTEYWPAYAFESTEGIVSSATVTIDSRVTMPQWNGYAAASDAARQEWDRFCAALRSHEQGHLDIVTAQLQSVDEQLMGKTESAAAGAWRDAMQALETATNDYDATTDHGRTQGTLIDVSII